MDAAIINNCNAIALPDDKLIHLGDVAWKGANLADLKARIACRNVFIVPGNHDKEDQLRRYFNILPQCHEYKTGDTTIVLCHYAMRVWNKSHHGSLHLYGHSHGTLPPMPGAAAFDIGVDSWNYHPLTLQEVKAEMRRLTANKPAHVVDHHGRDR